MKAKELRRIGYPEGPLIAVGRTAAGEARAAGMNAHQVRAMLKAVLIDPEQYKDHEHFDKLAAALIATGKAHSQGQSPLSYDWKEPLDYPCWGTEIDPAAHQQMENACRLPISVAAALMPDAHVGYGLPIGGVLATDNAVIPYAVGVDIACRMMLSVFDLPANLVRAQQGKLKRVLEDNTRFGIGSSWSPRRDHPVMDEDWNVTPVTSKLKDLAHKQLGTSGSGNHFVEFGEIELLQPFRDVEPGKYLALLSHSGSRGPGNKTATHYSKWAMSKHENLPKELRHLAWLDLDSDGAEYWAAMELMGKFASANHHIIHRQIVKALSEKPVFQVENHHNFAWRERHGDREVIVHRKGATPAGVGVFGVIPGSMATPGYLVEGKGHPDSLNSASHGAGRRMSRKAANSQFTWSEVRKYLKERDVELLSAGLDEAPWAYKDIDAVMAAQQDLAHPIARFMPKMVRMAPAGERPED